MTPTGCEASPLLCRLVLNSHLGGSVLSLTSLYNIGEANFTLEIGGGEIPKPN